MAKSTAFNPRTWVDGLARNLAVIVSGALGAFLAIPTHYEADYQANPLAQPKVALPENAREQLRQRIRFGQFEGGMMRSQ